MQHSKKNWPQLVIGTDKAFKTHLKSFFSEHGISDQQIHNIHPMKTELTIDQVRDLKKDLYIKQKNRLAYVFHDFDRSSLEAQNALLKALEEKNEDAYFIFLTKNIHKVIPTVVSRCQIIDLTGGKTVTAIDDKVTQSLNRIIATKKLDCFNDPIFKEVSKDKTLVLIDQIIFFFRQKLLVNPEIAVKIIKKGMLLKDKLDHNNLNPQLTLDSLLIFIWKSFTIKK